MRVVEDSASSTSCAIMNEEKSVNGTESDVCKNRKSHSTEHNHSPNSDHSEQGYASPGGRLKFFKGIQSLLQICMMYQFNLLKKDFSYLILN